VRAAARHCWREWLLESVDAQLEDLAAVLPVWRPDVIVCDPAMWGPLLVLQETAHIPLAIMSYVGACMLPGPDGPILGLPLPRTNGWFARYGRRLLRSVANAAGADLRRAAGHFRARYNLPPIGTTVTAFAGQMPLYLVPSTPAFDRQRRDLPRSVHYVGPCQWETPKGDSSPQWLTGLPKDRPLVYVTEGTLHAKPPLLLRAALRGLSSLSVQVIATTGKHRDPADLCLGAIPPNARVEQWVPHDDLLPCTDVVVTTGGTGTVLAALPAGVPLVVVPTAWDQPENAWRVAEAGAGIRLPPSQCTDEQLRAAVPERAQPAVVPRERPPLGRRLCPLRGRCSSRRPAGGPRYSPARLFAKCGESLAVGLLRRKSSPTGKQCHSCRHVGPNFPEPRS
jgi:MGT family glycosyltransferase